VVIGGQASLAHDLDVGALLKVDGGLLANEVGFPPKLDEASYEYYDYCHGEKLQQLGREEEYQQNSIPVQKQRIVCA
jgi:hypothetical protein